MRCPVPDFMRVVGENGALNYLNADKSSIGMPFVLTAN
jgi:hypothetical protein